MNKNSNKGATFAVYFASFLSYYYFFPIILLALLYTWYADLSQDLVIMVVTLPTLLTAFFNLGLTAILSKVSKKLVLIVGLALILLGGVLVVATQGSSFWIVLAASILAAAGYAAIINTSNLVLMELDPENANKNIGINAAVGCAGLMILSYVAGVMASDGYFPRVYYLNFLVILPIIALVLLYHPEKQQPAAQGGWDASAAAAPKQKLSPEGIKRFILLIIPIAIYTVGVAAWNNNTSAYIMIEKQIGTTVQTGMMSTLASLAGMLSGFFVVGPATKILKSRTIPVCMLWAGAWFCSIAFGTSMMFLLYAANFMFMIGTQPIYAKNITTASKALPAAVAVPLLTAVQGFMGFAAPYIVNFFGGLLGGTIPNRVQAGVIMIVIAAVLMFPIASKAESWE